MAAKSLAQHKNGAAPRLDLRSPNFSSEFKRAAKAYTAKITHSRQTAIDALVEAGILTPSGTLSKTYR